MTTYILNPDTGRPISIRGYGAMFGTLSLEPDISGRRLLFNSRCFDERLARGANINLTAFHMNDTALAATCLGNLKVWSDRHIGLAFEATDIPATPANRSMVAGIASGQIRGCSIQWQPFGTQLEDLGHSELIKVIRKAQVLHITLTDNPNFPTTGAWLSTEVADSLPGHMQWLNREWHNGHRSGLAAVKVRQRLHRPSPKAATKAKPKAKRRPAPFTDREIERLAEQEHQARRLMQDNQKRRRTRAA